MMTKVLVAALAGLGMSACAPSGGVYDGRGQDAVLAGQCFRPNQVTNFRVSNSQTLYISALRGYVYRLDAAPNCFDAGTSSVTVAPVVGGTYDNICVGDPVRVTVGRVSSKPLVCAARVSGPITDSNESGLPTRQN
ncbi:hypothetical protein D3C80_915900 [compost metagenome]